MYFPSTRLKARAIFQSPFGLNISTAFKTRIQHQRTFRNHWIQKTSKQDPHQYRQESRSPSSSWQHSRVFRCCSDLVGYCGSGGFGCFLSSVHHGRRFLRLSHHLLMPQRKI
eukprot:PhF_6_TR6095/c0_g1_i2/m.8948